MTQPGFDFTDGPSAPPTHRQMAESAKARRERCIAAYVAAEGPFRAALEAERDPTVDEGAAILAATLECQRYGILGDAVEACAELRAAE